MKTSALLLAAGSGLVCFFLLYQKLWVMKRDKKAAFLLISSFAILLLALSIFHYSRIQLVPFNADNNRFAVLLTGDEPAYLYTALSIAKDGDINLYNNNKNKDYLLFQNRPVGGSGFDFFNKISKNRLSAKKEQWNEKEYMRHRPGLSFFLSPVFRFANHNHRWWAYVMTSTVLALFCAGSFLMATGTLESSPPYAFAVCLGCSLAPPVFFYANQAYPEVLTGIFLATVILLMSTRKNRAIILAAFIMALAIWFTDRALLPVAVLSVTSLVMLRSRIYQSLVLAILGISGVGFALYCMHRFGVPYPISHNTIFGFSLNKLPVRILQVLFDAKQGWVWLFPPILLLPAVIWRSAFTKNRTLPGIAAVLSIIVILCLVAAFDDWRGGTNPRGRYYVIPQLIFCALLYLWATSADTNSKLNLYWLILLSSIALLQSAILIQHPNWWYRNYHPVFAWEKIQHFYTYLPDLPDDAPLSEWKKLIFWLPVFFIPSTMCLVGDRFFRPRRAKLSESV